MGRFLRKVSANVQPCPNREMVHVLSGGSARSKSWSLCWSWSFSFCWSLPGRGSPVTYGSPLSWADVARFVITKQLHFESFKFERRSMHPRDFLLTGVTLYRLLPLSH